MESEAVTKVAHDVVTVCPETYDNSRSSVTPVRISIVRICMIEMVLTGSTPALETWKL